MFAMEITSICKWSVTDQKCHKLSEYFEQLRVIVVFGKDLMNAFFVSLM